MRLKKISRKILDLIFNDFLDFDDLNKSEIDKIAILLQPFIKYEQIQQRPTKVRLSDIEKGQVLVKLLMSEDDPEQILYKLDWRYFELIIRSIFDSIGYFTTSNYRFKDEERKYEIDVIAYRYPYMFLIDAKFHKTVSLSYYKKAALQQQERTEALVDQFPIVSADLIKKLSLVTNQKIYMYPVVVTWKEREIHTYKGIPIVSIYRLSSFINQLDIYRYDLFNIKLIIH